MASERLSKLQKWILIKCAGRPVGMQRRQIVTGFFNGTSSRAAAEVSVTRSIWLLIERGYAEGLSPLPVELMAMIYGANGKSEEEFKSDYGSVVNEKNKKYRKIPVYSIRGVSKVKVVKLTPKGEEKAKELLNVK